MASSWTAQIVKIEGRGFAAFVDGIPLTANPYTQGYHNQNGPGGSVQRQRRMAWARGWALAKKQSEESKS